MDRLLGKPGSRVLLMGNEAIARGAIEAGVHVVTGYPGTPSSEVIMSLARVARHLKIKVDWFANEKVAFEVALAASNAGLRSLVTMKAPGINVAADALMSAAYCGVNGGMVILVADDPGPHTTQTEQDSRFYALLTNLPMVEPSNPQEAKDGIVWSFELSEKLKLPVLFRTTTRVNHTTGDVLLGVVREVSREIRFPRDLPRYVRASMKWNLNRHKWLNGRMKLAELCAEECPLNRVEGEGRLAIIASGISYAYVVEAVHSLNISGVRIFKLGMLNPFPKSIVDSALKGCEKILVVEELEPFIEVRLRALSTLVENPPVILGKFNGLIPREGELKPEVVKSAIASFMGLAYEPPKPLREFDVPSRPPPMCPGCPHRATYYALLKAIKDLGYKREDIPIFGDIGCYALSLQKPLEAIWTEHCMGASISMALGLKYAGYDKPVVATIGDSTFFHAGIPALIDAVHFGVNIVVVILDNRTTAMTGHQPHPGINVRADGSSATEVDIVDLVRGIGIKHVYAVDPYDVRRTVDVFKKVLSSFDGVQVVVARRECALLAKRRIGKLHVIAINREKCVKCRSCISSLGCPALLWDEFAGPVIDESLCIGCGVCAQVCPVNAIGVK
ncbi:MAG: indolepyruvate ferredoxin oxidoreductase subunit alpha [archaeon GB-1867-005]|nr:indolepyruvate ferredoxin oxidoreductase subunit alpha [Candidatus Culexmicrobium cathedralense]